MIKCGKCNVRNRKLHLVSLNEHTAKLFRNKRNKSLKVAESIVKAQ